MVRLASLVAAILLVPAASVSAQRVEDTFFNSVIPTRVDHLVGFIPTSFGIHPAGQRVKPITVRVGGRTHRYIFGNASATVTPEPDLARMIRGRRYPSPEGVFLDRRLTGVERRHAQVRADLGRDADVLVLARSHPACGTPVSREVAKGIATGRIHNWSAAGLPVPATGAAIALRRAGSGVGRLAEPRFGAGWRLPKGARAAADGGLSEAASGALGVAAVTSWSRARAYAATTCALPVGGPPPSDESVRALSYAGAYPITFVTLKRLRDVRPIAAAFLNYLTSARATGYFLQRGMLLVNKQWPTVPGQSQDPAGP